MVYSSIATTTGHTSTTPGSAGCAVFGEVSLYTQWAAAPYSASGEPFRPNRRRRTLHGRTSACETLSMCIDAHVRTYAWQSAVPQGSQIRQVQGQEGSVFRCNKAPKE